MTTLVYMILILGVVVFIHEFGHFLFAKNAGIYVYEFSLGMGPVVYSFHRRNDETVYSLRLFPIGGFVQMAGEEIEPDDKIPFDKTIQSTTWIQRFMTIIAGIMFNFILAFVVFFIVGRVNGASQNKPYIKFVQDGINSNVVFEGDRILAVNGKKVLFTDVLILDIHLNSDKPLNLRVRGVDGVERDVVLNPIEVDENGEKGYKYGIALADDVKTGVIASIKYSVVKFTSLIVQMSLIIVNLYL